MNAWLSLKRRGENALSTEKVTRLKSSMAAWRNKMMPASIVRMVIFNLDQTSIGLVASAKKESRTVSSTRKMEHANSANSITL